ncbi:MAG: hypothetical protein QOC56_2238 [Alphaproteobacteria bacterium]|nr:hypothetical protein [Alphaproteobacteria bacterium]
MIFVNTAAIVNDCFDLPLFCFQHKHYENS